MRIVTVVGARPAPLRVSRRGNTEFLVRVGQNEKTLLRWRTHEVCFCNFTLYSTG
jgi:hypothetical protein